MSEPQKCYECGGLGSVVEGPYLLACPLDCQRDADTNPVSCDYCGLQMIERDAIAVPGLDAFACSETCRAACIAWSAEVA